MWRWYDRLCENQVISAAFDRPRRCQLEDEATSKQKSISTWKCNSLFQIGYSHLLCNIKLGEALYPRLAYPLFCGICLLRVIKSLDDRCAKIICAAAARI